MVIQNDIGVFTRIMRYFLCLLIGLICTPMVWGSEASIVVESVLVDKSERKMWLIVDGEKYKVYDIALGDQPIGHKAEEGDQKTPEGQYLLDYRNPKSRYHLSLHINYPQKADRDQAASRGVSPGGDIFIHGLPNGLGRFPSLFKGRDWTDGCIAVANDEITEIWRLVKDGTPIKIMP